MHLRLVPFWDNLLLRDMNDFIVGALCTLTVTGETLLIKENFPSIKKGFFGHYVCKVGKKGFVPV